MPYFPANETFCPIQTLSLPFNYFKIISSQRFVVAVAVFFFETIDQT